MRPFFCTIKVPGKTRVSYDHTLKQKLFYLEMVVEYSSQTHFSKLFELY